MELKKYLEKYDITVEMFSKQTKISVPTLYRVMRGLACTWMTATTIVKVTNREVGLKDLKIK